MRKSLLPFALLLMLPGLLMAYTISVKGIVYGDHQQGLPGIVVKIQSGDTDIFAVDTAVKTGEHGNFVLELEVPDEVEKGTLLFSIEGCDQAKRIVYRTNHTNHALTLRYCHASDACAVRIIAEPLDDLSYLLTATTKGPEPVNYEWSTGDTTSSITSNDSRVYWVIATTADGCKARDVYQIKNDRPCKTEIHLLPAVSDSTRFLLVARSFGQGPFTYLWSTGDTTQSIAIDSVGEYCVRVQDANGCESRDCKVIAEPICETEIHAIHPATNSDLFAFHLLVRTKGRPPFSYQWSTGDSTKMIRVSEPGEYCVIVTDALGCISRDCILIDPRTDCKTEIALLPNLNAVSLQLQLVARSHGRPPFHYEWNTGDTTKSIPVGDLIEYCVNVTDANGCVSTDCIDLSLLALECSVAIHRAGGRTLIAQPRGFPPFRYEWSTGDTTRLIHPDTAGEYCVKVTNGFGCVAEACVILGSNSDQCRLKIHKRALPNQAGYELTAVVHPNIKYHFLWSTGDTTSSIIVDAEGEYCVEATGNTCQIKDCLEVKFGQGIAFSDQSLYEIGSQSAVNEKVRIFVAPNPVVSELRVSWAAQVRATKIIVRHISGYAVIVKDIPAGTFLDSLSIDVSALSPGIYTVQLLGENLNEQIKIMKSH